MARGEEKGSNSILKSYLRRLATPYKDKSSNTLGAGLENESMLTHWNKEKTGPTLWVHRGQEAATCETWNNTAQ